MEGGLLKYKQEIARGRRVGGGLFQVGTPPMAYIACEISVKAFCLFSQLLSFTFSTTKVWHDVIEDRHHVDQV